MVNHIPQDLQESAIDFNIHLDIQIECVSETSVQSSSSGGTNALVISCSSSIPNLAEIPDPSSATNILEIPGPSAANIEDKV